MSHIVVEKTVTDPDTGASTTSSDLTAPDSPRAFLAQVQQILGPDARKISGSVAMIGDAVVCKDLAFLSTRGRMTVTADARNRPVFFDATGAKVGPYDQKRSDMLVSSQLLFSQGTMPLRMRRKMAQLGQNITSPSFPGIFGISALLGLVSGTVGVVGSHLVPVEWWILSAVTGAVLVLALLVARNTEHTAFFHAMVTDLHLGGISYVRDFSNVKLIPRKGARSVGSPGYPGGRMTREEMQQVGRKSLATAIVSRDGELQRVFVMKDHYEFFHLD